MHDPMTLVFRIKSPFKRNGYRPSLLDIWHVDPEKDGTDDSCGWFMRVRHGDPEVLNRIKNDFEFGYKYWFDEDTGAPLMSIQAIVLGMFSQAAWVTFKYKSKKFDKFMRDNLFQILKFAENPVDSMRNSITQKYGPEPKERRLEKFAATVYPWILRADRPWWKHPRFHFHHWKINCPPILIFKRWLFSRCCKCGGRFRYGESPVSNSWGGGGGPRWFRNEPGVYHSACGSMRGMGRDSGQKG